MVLFLPWSSIHIPSLYSARTTLTRIFFLLRCKRMELRQEPIWKPPRAINDHSHILDSLARSHPALLLQTAPLLRREVQTAHVPIILPRLRRCMMQNIITVWIAVHFRNKPNTASPELSTRRNNRRVVPDIAYVGVDMIRTLTCGNPSIMSHAATYFPTVSAGKLKYQGKSIHASREYSPCHYQ